MTKNFQSLYLYFLFIISPITICYQTNLIINIQPAMSQVPTSSEDFKEIERMNNQALVLQEEGKYKEAETLFLKAIEKFKISPNKDFKNMTILLSNLASLYGIQKDYAKIESTLLEIFDIYIKIEEHKSRNPLNALYLVSDFDFFSLILESITALESLYENQKRYDELEGLYLRKLKANKGKDRFTSIKLGNFYRKQKRYNEAEKILLEVFEEEKQRTPGKDFFSNTFLQVSQGLGDVYKEQKKYKELENLYLQVFRISKTQTGTDNFLFIESAKLLSKFYRDQERYNESEKLSLEVLKIIEKELKEDPLAFLTEINQLIRFYEDEKEYDEKKYRELENIYLQSLELNQKEIDKDPDTFLDRVDNLAQSYTEQKRYEQAKKLYLKVIEMYKDSLGEDSPYIKRILFKMEVMETDIDT